MKNSETKGDRFQRLAEARVNKIIKMIRLLGNLSGVTYEYTGEQVSKIFSALQIELNEARKRYCGNGKKTKRFSLSEQSHYHVSLDEFPDVFLPLPDGTYLRAVAMDDQKCPAINVYLGEPVTGELRQICFIEYNPDKKAGNQICIGVYQSGREDTVFYKAYMQEKESNADEQKG